MAPREMLRGERLDYKVDGEGRLVGAPGCCHECLNGQLYELDPFSYGQGHFLCESVPTKLLKLAEVGAISCHLESGSWTWYWNFN